MTSSSDWMMTLSQTREFRPLSCAGLACASTSCLLSSKTWMAGTSPAMTSERDDKRFFCSSRSSNPLFPTRCNLESHRKHQAVGCHVGLREALDGGADFGLRGLVLVSDRR